MEIPFGEEHHLHTSLTRIGDLSSTSYRLDALSHDRWRTGDYVAGEVIGHATGQKIELRTGRRAELTQGALVVGALGHRHATLEATGTWQSVGDDGRMEILTGGGLLGRCTSLSMMLPPLPEIQYRGHVHRADDPLNMKDFVKRSAGAGDFRTPTVVVIGTSMSAGKTTAAGIVIRRLKAMGLKVAAAKVTGAGRYRDILSFHDAGADFVCDFVDAGLPSTICPEAKYRESLQLLLTKLAAASGDVAVIEIGASPLEPYNGSVAMNELRDTTRMTLLCASDPYAVMGVVDAFDRRPDLVTGPASNTLAGVELVNNLTGLTCLNVRDRSTQGELDRILRSRLPPLDGADPATSDANPEPGAGAS